MRPVPALGSGAEEGDPPAAHVPERTRPQHHSHDGDAGRVSAPHRGRERGVRDTVLRHRDDDEVGEQGAVRVQVPGDDGGSCCAPTTRIRRSAATGGSAAPLPSSTIRSGSSSSASRDACEHVRGAHRSREPAAAAAAADRLQTGQRRGLEVIRRRVAAGTREREQVVDRRPGLDELRLCRARPAPSRRRRPAGRARASRRRDRSRPSCRRASRSRSRRSTACRSARTAAGRA